MEYETQAQALGLGELYAPGQVAGIQTARTDLSSVRNRLAECVKRAHDLGVGAHSLADSIVGQRAAENSPPRGNAASPVEPSISTLVDDLAYALSRIESGLARL
jgi:hypothetical protein